ncbi:Glutamate--tRNA ligase 2, partial [Pseudolycoriella hygida]
MSSKSSINNLELEKFDQLSNQWWQKDGEFKILHQINPIRLSYIVKMIKSHFQIDQSEHSNITLKILDVGCGGGLVSSGLCRDMQNISNVNITGIDALQNNINIATKYAQEQNLPIKYFKTTIEEEVVKQQYNYDVILCLEVIEHVDNVENFIYNLSNLIKPGGMIIISTINRTIKAYMLAIIMAEYCLGWIKKSTHSYNKFLRPSEIYGMFNKFNIELKELKGLTYNIIDNDWQLSNDINYSQNIIAKNIITRFAPSPTGFLHIGGARTALFNYLFAKHHKGKFLLRIEDTDQARSSNEALQAIFSGLQWLDLNWDGEVIFQSRRNNLYKEAALKLAPRVGYTIIHDNLQGNVVIQNSHLDDMVLLRNNGIATYMLAVVVDDHAMQISHIIRGDDHLTNTARQILLYQAFGWDIPNMTHIPLIYGDDGAKLSKRHGALGVQAYKDMGYLPEALSNYLLRLGWSHQNNEIISRQQAIEWFTLDGLGKSPSRIDFAKMNNLNAHYLRHMDEQILIDIICNILQKNHQISQEEKQYIITAMPSLKIRSTNLIELAELTKIYLVNSQIVFSKQAKEIIDNCDRKLIKQVICQLENLPAFDKDNIQVILKEIATNNNLKLADLMQPIRALLTGSVSSPSVFEIISIIGKENTISRLNIFDS